MEMLLRLSVIFQPLNLDHQAQSMSFGAGNFIPSLLSRTGEFFASFARLFDLFRELLDPPKPFCEIEIIFGEHLCRV
jgi:hypothetical protein